MAVLNEMVVELAKEKELGLSLQYESQTHFRPVCSIMNISTRTHDYIIDVSILGDELKVLNPVLSDEKVLKVMYKKLKDMETLQHTLGLWVGYVLFVLILGLGLNPIQG